MSGEVLIDFDMSAVADSLGQLGARVDNVPLEIYANDLLVAIDDLIQSEGAASGEPWQPLSPGTLARHPRRVGGKLLQATGLLANFQPIVEGSTFGARSPAPYVGFHVTGTRLMPRRDPTAIDMEAFLEQIATSLLDDATGGFG